jgi:hypothetical protein
MAKISYKLVPPEFDISYSKALSINDRYTFSSVRRARLFTSRARIQGITQKSVLPLASVAWNALSTEDRDVWNSAGVASNLTGWRLFVKDFAWSQKLELGSPLLPSTEYQVEVGRLTITSPASSIKIAQLHPRTYYVLRKITGKKSMYEPVEVVESFSLPLELTLSWQTTLTSAGASPLVRAFIVVYSHYQGRDIETELSLPFGLTDAWTRDSVTLSSVLGVVKGYTVFIEASDVVGDIYFDNLSIIHNGQNWARDPYCYNIASTYTRAFFQIPKHWVTIELPEGASYDSFYYNQLLA